MGWQHALLVLLTAVSAWAQSANSSVQGVVTGTVLDSHRQPVAAAKVYLQSADRKDLSAGQADASGVYRFAVESGTYTVRTETVGGDEASAGPFEVVRGKLTRIDLILKAAPAAQPQFFDEPHFTIAGVTDNTYRGAHGADTVLRSAEDLAKATASLGNVREPSPDPLESVRRFQRVAELDPSEANLFNWGTELLIHRAFEPAVQVFTKGVRLFPQSVRMLLGLATAWYSSGSYQQAADCFFRAVDLDPANAEPYLFLNKVQAREITGSAGYEERLARFARLQPSNAFANYLLAVSIWNHRTGPEDLESVKRSHALLEKALALDSHLGTAYLQLGIVYASERRFSEAIPLYLKAIEANAALDEAHYRLSEAYRLTGEATKAREELAIYSQRSKQSAERVEEERRHVQQFVVSLRSQTQASEPK